MKMKSRKLVKVSRHGKEDVPNDLTYKKWLIGEDEIKEVGKGILSWQARCSK